MKTIINGLREKLNVLPSGSVPFCKRVYFPAFLVASRSRLRLETPDMEGRHPIRVLY